MSCKLTYDINSGGRSLHKLGEILSVYIYDLLLDVDTKIVCHGSWFSRDQRIFQDFGVPPFNPNLPTLYIDNYTKSNPDYWWGITYKDFKDINSRVSNYVNKKGKCNVVLTNLAAITPTKLSNWYHKGYIKEDLYTTKLIPRLKKLFFTGTGYSRDPKEHIAIHARRGDMYWQLVEAGKGLTCKDYKNIIPRIQDHYGLPVTVYTEVYNSDDLSPLAKLPDVTLSRGDRTQTKRDFYNLVNSKVLVISPESVYSTWAAYLHEGDVLVPDDLFVKCIQGDVGGFLNFPKNFKNLSALCVPAGKFNYNLK